MLISKIEKQIIDGDQKMISNYGRFTLSRKKYYLNWIFLKLIQCRFAFISESFSVIVCLFEIVKVLPYLFNKIICLWNVFGFFYFVQWLVPNLGCISYKAFFRAPIHNFFSLFLELNCLFLQLIIICVIVKPYWLLYKLC